MNSCVYKNLNGLFRCLTRPIHLSQCRNLQISYSKVKETESVECLPVIIIHGLFGSQKNWSSMAKALSKTLKAEVISVDCRNHGDSPHSDEMNYHVMAEDITHMMTDLSIPKAHIIGHSMGGKAAMVMTLNEPDLVSKLIIEDVSPDHGREPITTKFPAYLTAMANVTFDHSLPMHQLRSSVSHQLKKVVRDKAELNFIVTNIIKKDTGYAWRINIHAIKDNLADIIGFPLMDSFFMGPTFFIGGKDSDHIGKKHVGEIMRLFPNAEIKHLEKCGHWIHAERPNEFLKQVTDFIRKES